MCLHKKEELNLVFQMAKVKEASKRTCGPILLHTAALVEWMSQHASLHQPLCKYVVIEKT